MAFTRSSEMIRPPSLRSIVWVDEIALIAALCPVIAIVLGAAAAAGVLPDLHGSGRSGDPGPFPGDAATVFYVMAAAALVIGVAVIGWRVGKVQAAFALGFEVPGRITRITRFKDRAYLHYAYEVASSAITTTHFVHQTKAVKALAEGQAVTVAVNPRSPRVGFVVELFG
jgi:hypothetical protein